MLDVNSLYPSVLHDKPMPYGEPVYFEGEYKQDDTYPLYIQQLTCCFKVKPNHIPTIQLKKHLSFLPNEYIENSGIDPVCLTLTNIDLKLFFEHYDVYSPKYHCGWKFRDIKGLFNDYIDKWMEVKKQATIDKNFGLRTLAKLQLNSLYGKFATKLTAKSKVPYIGDDDIVHYLTTEEEEKDGIYLPVAIFTTAFAREKTIRTSQAIKEYSLKKYGKDLHCYNDTDSIHCLLPIEELEQFCDIDPIRLGAWKHEGDFTKAKFVRQKCYLEQIDGDMHITCAGMPKTCYDSVTWDAFKTGFTCGGKLTFKHVKGGVKLIPTDFTIKEEKVKTIIEKFEI